MKKSMYIFMAIGLLVAVFASACGTPATTQQAPPPPAQSVDTAVPPPAAEAPTATTAAQQAFAPACQGSSSCSAPDVTDTAANTTYCVKKVPWQNILAPAGTTFEPVPKDTDPKFFPLICQDAGTVVDGKEVFSCRGQELWTYDLKVTSPSCGGAANLQTGTTNCAEGQGYDAANNCCSAVDASGGGSVMIKVNLGACPTK